MVNVKFLNTKGNSKMFSTAAKELLKESMSSENFSNIPKPHFHGMIIKQ